MLSWWSTWQMALTLHRLGAALIAAEAAAALLMMAGTWLLRPDLIKSRTVILAMSWFCVVVMADRLLAAVGYPPGWVGQMVVALSGGGVIVSAALYHTSLGEIPRPVDLAIAMARAEDALAQAEAARADAALARAAAKTAACEAFASCSAKLEQSGQQFLMLRRSIGVVDG